MNYRKFRGTDISEIGLGTWQLGSADWGTVDEEDAFAILQSFVENGGNIIDTADVYGMGTSETIIGKFLRGCNTPVYVASKLGRRHSEPGGWKENLTYNAMRKSVERTLEHLRLDSLFLEQLHCIPTDELRAGEVFDHLRLLQQQGLIQHWGVSVETSEEAMLCLQQEGISSLQIIFNLFRQHVAEELFAEANAKGVALIIRVPLASGLLSGKFKQTTVFDEGDHRNFNADGEAFNAGETFSGIAFARGVKLAQQIGTMLPDEKMAAWAIRWILDHPEVTTVIPGASKVAQVESNVSASSLPALSEELHQRLRELYNRDVRPYIRGHY
jgi:aryl-alcohol dehydrogenase-like predicted oxidoreductase